MRRRTIWRNVLIGSIIILIGIGNTFLTHTAHAAEQITLNAGHTDVFNVERKNGELVLDLTEDVTGSHVHRNPENVNLVVKKQSFTKQISQFIPEITDGAYVLPLTQNQELLWAGWNTSAVRSSSEEAESQDEFSEITLNFLKITKPENAHVYLFTQDAFGTSAQSLLSNNQFEITDGSTLIQKEPSHVHAYWAFDKPGTYTFSVNASGERGGKTYTSNTAHYTWNVEDKDTETNNASLNEQSPNTNANNNVSNENNNSNSSANNQATESSNTPTATKTTATCFPHQEFSAHAKQLSILIKDDRTTPAQWRSPESITFHIGNSGKTTTKQQIGNIPANTSVWMIGATQVANVPWVGANTMHESLLQNTTGNITWKLSSYSGAGNVEVFASGNFGQTIGQHWFSGTPQGSVSGSVSLNRNTHVHPNWVFTKPGTYRLGITQSATLKNGTPITATATITFNVGTGAGVQSGHFDIGASVGNGAQTVWRDAQGNSCTPDAVDLAAAQSNNLAQTGTLHHIFTILAIGFIILSIGIFNYRKSSTINSSI